MNIYSSLLLSLAITQTIAHTTMTVLNIGNKTYQQCVDACESTGKELATKQEILDYLSSNGGALSGDAWTPIGEDYNNWLQIGLGPFWPYGKLHTEIVNGDWGKPDWGTQQTIREFKQTFYCAGYSYTHEIPVIYGYADRFGSGSQTPYTMNGQTAIIWSNAITSPRRSNVGNMLNPLNGRFTAPITGLYTFTVSAYLSGGCEIDLEMWCNYNGQRAETFSSLINQLNTAIRVGSITMKMNKNDYVEFAMYSDSQAVRELYENEFHTFAHWALIQSLE